MGLQVQDIAALLGFKARAALLAGGPIGVSPVRGDLERFGLCDRLGVVHPLGRAVAQALAVAPKKAKDRRHKYDAKPCYLTAAGEIVLTTRINQATGRAERVDRHPTWLRFDSLHEAREWLRLQQFARTGQIRDLQRQIGFPLYGMTVAGARVKIATLVVDFTYTEKSGHAVVADAKGVRTAMYLLKKRWLKAQEGIDIVEV